MSKVTLIGRTGAAAQTRGLADGSRLLTLSVGTTHAWIDGTEAKQETQWHNVTVWESTPGFSLFEQLGPGSQVYVEGMLRIKTVERNGEKQQYVNVNVSQGYGMIRVLWSPRKEAADDGHLPF